MAILHVENLSAGYGNGPVIADISFSLEPGEFVTILGPNGSGKSTLIKAVQGLLREISGRVEVERKNLFRMKRRDVSKIIAFVPQLFELAFDYTVREIVAMGRYAHQGRLSGLSAEETRLIHRVLDIFGIRHLQNRKVSQLSGGERQRAFIARAMVQDTPLLFLDEPSAHLDLNYSLEIFQVLEKLQKQLGKTILLTEHNINLVIPYSQRIIFLKEGRIRAQGPPEALITRVRIQEVFGADVEIRENLHSKLPEISLIHRHPENKDHGQ
ncbi:MAG: ABC transporter ATP-binding protein [Candidatus Aminicenantes bacterium]|nr:ABC transporter ATP-binding protein [Candidatus Aminicenantes bacterium]